MLICVQVIPALGLSLNREKQTHTHTHTHTQGWDSESTDQQIPCLNNRCQPHE